MSTWEERALYLQMMNVRLFQRITRLPSPPSPPTDFEGAISDYQSATGTGKACVLVGVGPTIENRIEIYKAVKLVSACSRASSP
jgi:hypothetical protein